MLVHFFISCFLGVLDYFAIVIHFSTFIRVSRIVLNRLKTHGSRVPNFQRRILPIILALVLGPSQSAVIETCSINIVDLENIREQLTRQNYNDLLQASEEKGFLWKIPTFPSSNYEEVGQVENSDLSFLATEKGSVRNTLSNIRKTWPNIFHALPPFEIFTTGREIIILKRFPNSLNNVTTFTTFQEVNYTVYTLTRAYAKRQKKFEWNSLLIPIQYCFLICFLTMFFGEDVTIVIDIN